MFGKSQEGLESRESNRDFEREEGRKLECRKEANDDTVGRTDGRRETQRAGPDGRTDGRAREEQ